MLVKRWIEIAIMETEVRERDLARLIGKSSTTAARRSQPELCTVEQAQMRSHPGRRVAGEDDADANAADRAAWVVARATSQRGERHLSTRSDGNGLHGRIGNGLESEAKEAETENEVDVRLVVRERSGSELLERDGGDSVDSEEGSDERNDRDGRQCDGKNRQHKRRLQLEQEKVRLEENGSERNFG
jgi:hypothetical protein